jgi:beta-phosphoglucomutase-like phosphatase (HAD superfamily)
MIDTIIFDLEGVIIDTPRLWDKSQKIFLEKKGVEYDRSVLKTLLTGKSLSEGVEIMKTMYNLEESLVELEKERRSVIDELFAGEINFILGFKDFFQKIKDNYKTCIASSLDKALFAEADRKLNISKMFGGQTFFIEDVGNISKPNPEIFLHSAKKLGSRPEQCIVIEDSPNGLKAAKAANMKSIGLLTTFDKSELGQADVLVNSYEEINLKDI